MKAPATHRLAWGMAAVAVALDVAGVALQAVAPRFHPGVTFVVPGFAFAAVGGLVASRRPRNAIGWIFLGIGMLRGIGTFSLGFGSFGLFDRPEPIAGSLVLAWLGQWVWLPEIVGASTLMFLLFPDGRPASRRWRIMVPIAAVVILWGSVGAALQRGPLEDLEPFINPFGVVDPERSWVWGMAFPAMMATIVTSVVSMVLRFRRSRGVEREQLKIFTFAAAAMGLVLVPGFVLFERYPVVVSNSLLVALTALPVAAGIAILRFRLFDIDVVIRRTVMFGLLGGFITAVYVAIVVGVGAFVGRRGGLVLPGVAAAIVALAFQPARQRARHVANRLVYGKRATPYQVLSEFSDRLGEAYAVEDVLPRMAQLLRDGTGAVSATVWVRVGEELRPSATSPSEGADELRPVRFDGDALLGLPGNALPVRHSEEVLGALSVKKAKADPLTPAEEKLLDDLAAQAGLVLRNVRLTEELKANLEELRASRERLVTAQDEERRRIERNIHDGAQQQLVALAVNLKLARTVAETDPGKAQEMLQRLQSDTQAALEDLRDLARGIYPPLLADKGLSAALEAQARKVPFPVEVEPNGLGRYPQEIEAAIYFCVLEALQNAAKYAEASRTIVRLRRENGAVVFEVEDDGRGFDPEGTAKGAGLQNMTDRLEALGGSLEVRSAPGSGTTVAGKVPVRAAGGLT